MDDDFETKTDVDVSIHAGFPNPATDKRLHSLDLNQLLITNPSSTFLFRVRGEQGNAYGIFDGDIAIIDRALAPIGNDYALWHDGRHFKLSQTTDTPDGCIIWGVVTAIIHSYRKNIVS